MRGDYFADDDPMLPLTPPPDFDWQRFALGFLWCSAYLAVGVCCWWLGHQLWGGQP